jgi:hypothetical protein
MTWRFMELTRAVSNGLWYSACKILVLFKVGHHQIVSVSVCLSIYLSIYLSVSLSVDLSPVAPTWSLSLQFLNIRQSVGLLGRGINPTQGRYLHRTTQTQNKRRQTSMTWVGFEPTIPVRTGEDISCLRPRGQYDRPAENNADHYIIVKKLLNSIFGTRWEPKWLYQRSLWTQKDLLRNVSYLRYVVHSRVDLDEVRYHYRAFMFCYRRFVHDGGITLLDGGSV